MPTHPNATRTPRKTVTPYPTPTRAATLTPENTSSPTPETWFDRYTISSLRERAYGLGQPEIVEEVKGGNSYSRFIFRYPSDTLTIYGYANIPRGKGPFPVIVMLHGRSNVESYATLTENEQYARMFAEQGFIVLHPNLRNYPPSDQGENYFLAGMAIDVLNLIGLVKAGSGQPGLFKNAAPEKIGLWAFSMGGALAWRVLVVSPDIKGAFLYSPMSGDDYQNAVSMAKAGTDAEAQQTLGLPAYAFPIVSPKNFYQDITAVVDIHHGTADTVIPVDWSRQACQQLKNLGRNVRCYFYDNSDHVFRGDAGVKLKVRMLNFFNAHVKTPAPVTTPGP